MNIELKPRAERELSVDQVIEELRPKLSQVPGIRVFMVNPPPINIGARRTRALYQFTLQDTDTDELYRWAPILEEKMRELPGLQDVNTDLLVNNPQLIDRPEPRPDFRARPHGQPGPDGDVQCLRHAADLPDLRAEQPVPGPSRRRSRVPEGPVRALTALRPVVERPSHRARRGRRRRPRRPDR